VEGDSRGRILVVDDEPAIVEILSRYLRDDGFVVLEASDGATAVNAALAERPDLIILDLNLPGLHGSEVFRRVRATYDVPVIMLTSRQDEVDRVVGLELGADDYVGKPFSPREIVARVKTVLRRARLGSGAADESQAAVDDTRARNVLNLGTLEIDRSAYEVRIGGKPINLTPTEFRLLDVLATNLGWALSREQLLDKMSRDTDIYDRTLDRHIANLRRKIEDDPAHPTRVITVLGVGYKLAAPE
jgi:two-component system alkaline phosphatase synthesis response regulator PhoP